MILPKFEYHEPANVDEACRLMSELGKEARPIAGGTDLLVNMKKGLISPRDVVSLGKIPELKDMDFDGTRVSIGACVTAAELAESDMIRKKAGALSSGAGSLGSPLVRNLATIAGNLVTARPAADFPPPLMALGAEAVLKNREGERAVSMEEFFLGPGETVMKYDEILTGLRFDAPADDSGAAYFKLGVRKSLEISLVNTAAFVSMGRGDVIENVRIVLGSVSPTPIRAVSAEKLLKGEKVTDKILDMAGNAAREECSPIDDFRASAEYKRDMVAVFTKRALAAAVQNATA